MKPAKVTVRVDVSNNVYDNVVLTTQRSVQYRVLDIVWDNARRNVWLKVRSHVWRNI